MRSQQSLKGTGNGELVIGNRGKLCRLGTATDRVALKLKESDRELHLAVPKATDEKLFQEILIQKVFEFYPANITIHDRYFLFRTG